ncbi:MAG: PEGA domain-containing protein [Spirochaetota bacterium]
MTGKRSVIVTALAIVGASLLVAQAPPTPELPFLPEARETFRIGIAELIAEGVPPERRFVTTTLPILAYDSLREIEAREMDGNELEAFAEQRLISARRAAASQLAEAVAARDALLFQDEANEQAREEAVEAVADARVSWVALAEARASDLVAGGGASSDRGMPTPDGSPGIRADEPADPPTATRPVEFLDLHEAGQLLPAPLATILDNPLVGLDAPAANEAPELLRLADEQDLDYLVFGFAEQRAGYIVVDLYGYHRALDIVELLSRTTRLAEEIGDDAQPIADEAATTLLGRDYARLVIRSDRSDASIRVNGELLGFGEATLRYAEAGEYSVEIDAADSEPVRRVVQLDAGDRETITVEMVARAGNLVRLRSSPSDAAVYVDSVWVGQTPLEYEFPLANSSVRLRKPGYLESRFVVGPDSPATVSRALLREDIDWTVELEQARDSFYQSFAFFVVSLPVTIVLRGSYLNLETAILSGGTAIDDDRRSELVRQANTLYWATWGSVFVNVGLLVNVAINIIDYVRVGEGAHNQ